MGSGQSQTGGEIRTRGVRCGSGRRAGYAREHLGAAYVGPACFHPASASMRLVLLAAVVFALAPTAHAQLPSISIGVAGGPNFSSFNEINGSTLDGTTGYHAGLFADVSVPFIALRTGVYYLTAGNVQTAGGADIVKADFVTVPVDFRLQTPTPIVRAYVLAGPEFRFPVSSDDGGIGGVGVPSVDRRSVNVAAHVGVGVAFKAPLVGPSAFAELRYSQDVTGFAEEQGLTTDNEYKLSLVQIRLGVGL